MLSKRKLKLLMICMKGRPNLTPIHYRTLILESKTNNFQMKCKNNLHKLNYYLIISNLLLCLSLSLHLSSCLNQLQEATVWRWPGNLLRLPQQPAPPPPRLSWRFGCRLTSSLSLHSNPTTEVLGMKSRYYKGGHWCNQKISKIT